MFVMIKVKSTTESLELLPKDSYHLSERSDEVCLSFTSSVKKPCTCTLSDITPLSKALSQLLLNDVENTSTPIVKALPQLTDVSDFDSNPCENSGASTNTFCEMGDHCMWFQVAWSLKGFKNQKFEGKSVIDLWHKHSFIS